MKNTATRNGKEYPIMYVWDGTTRPPRPSKRIIIFCDPTTCIAVVERHNEAFVSGKSFEYFAYAHCAPIPEQRAPTAFEIAKFVGEHPNALYRTKMASVSSLYIYSKEKIDAINFNAKDYSLVIGEDPRTQFSIPSDKIEYSLDDGKTWTHFMVEDDV